MENEYKNKNKENKKGLRWGEEYEDTEEVNSDKESETQLELNVKINKIKNYVTTMENESSSINEADSVRDDSNKVSTVESYLSDTSASNYINPKSTSEGSEDKVNLLQGYLDSNVSEIKKEFAELSPQTLKYSSIESKLEKYNQQKREDRYSTYRMSSRTVISDEESKDSLDRLWNMKTFMHDMKTEYSRQREEGGVDYGDEFKSAYVNNMDTNRLDQSVLESKSMEQTDLAVEYYKFELEKMDKIVKVLKSQLTERDQKISLLSEKVLEYDQWRSELDPNRQASVVQYKAENEAFVAVNFAKLQAQVDENERLTQRLMKMEETHRDKDDEIRGLREKILENEVSSARFDRELKSLEIDKQMLKNSIDSMEKTFRQRELQMKLNLDMEYQNQLSNILKEQEQLMSLVADKDSEIEKCKELLRTARHECSQLLNSIVRLKEVLIKKNQEIDHYKNKVLELESSLIANDKTSELKISRDTQSKLRDKIRKLEQKLEMYEESTKVTSQMKEENLYLRAKLDKLQNVDMRDRISQSVIELGNQMMPLSLANLRDS
ncbi:conserved hypothetical protein [Theileria orientalis strain Shintoku]|uniref:Uncharacterized protein n=1 Tax=Theileria orientalis strain Shintoku TaxID=869250 RepID=J4C8A2_THEOR|nr:conserved hypothetical protein [Theileria orientalis strain Shintoku]PVC52141.1 hypothetical protein MACL_00000986 [Theileria orientalis]BAM40433.1 conserved hypothetical protein [Theileria orientalis strain Shintoku]|eukprot:XP_009690734.1 conserved hypothetical protein [Theileria orientalis strain Shintoku]